MGVAAGMAVMAVMFKPRSPGVRAEGPAQPPPSCGRHGTGKGSVTLGGRRVPVDRPQARAVDGHEAPLPTRARPGSAAGTGAGATSTTRGRSAARGSAAPCHRSAGKESVAERR